MADLDLDDVKLKEREALTEDEEKLITDKWDELGDEDKEAYKDLDPNKEPEEEDSEDAPELEEEADKEKEEEREEVKEELKGVRFDSEEEFEAAVDKIVAKREAAKQTPAEEEAPPEKFFPEGFKAKNWEDAAQQMYPKFKERVISDIRGMTEAQKKRLDDINKQFDEEIETLRKGGEEIPEPGTPEREQFDKDLAGIGLKYKLSNMTDSYEVYKALNTNKKEEEPKEENKQEPAKAPSAQKNLASKVSKGAGEGKSESPKEYGRLSKSMDELLEEEAGDLI